MSPGTIVVPPRKRTVRACDQCRRRKVKCNGKLSCIECDGLGLSCSYGSQFKQSRGPSYVIHLEKKIARLEYELQRASEPAQHIPGTSVSKTSSQIQPRASPEAKASPTSPESHNASNNWTHDQLQCPSSSPDGDWDSTNVTDVFSKDSSSSLPFNSPQYAGNVGPPVSTIWAQAPFVPISMAGSTLPFKYNEFPSIDAHGFRNYPWGWNPVPSNVCTLVDPPHPRSQPVNFSTW